MNVDLKSFTTWINDAEMTYAMSRGRVNKDLRVLMHGIFRVYHNGSVVLETPFAIDAVDKYNSITQ